LWALASLAEAAGRLGEPGSRKLREVGSGGLGGSGSGKLGRWQLRPEHLLLIRPGAMDTSGRPLTTEHGRAQGSRRCFLFWGDGKWEWKTDGDKKGATKSMGNGV